MYCEFHVARLEFFYYDYVLGRDSFNSDPGEYVIVEKDYRTLGGVEPVWAYLVFLESEGQLRSVLIRSISSKKRNLFQMTASCAE
jgi:hypothetical protein